MMYLLFALVAVIAYVIGSFNYSIILSTVFMNADIRSKGSGNAGSTNMLRNYGWSAGVITLLTDFMKTIVATLGAWAVFIQTYPDLAKTATAVAGFFCAVGHCFPVFFKFKGGKGVAVGAMMILMVDFRSFLVVIGAFLILVALFRYISLGSMAGAASFPISLAFFTDYSNVADVITLGFAIAVATMVIALHTPNIVRLVKGTESKLSFSKK